MLLTFGTWFVGVVVALIVFVSTAVAHDKHEAFYSRNKDQIDRLERYKLENPRDPPGFVHIPLNVNSSGFFGFFKVVFGIVIIVGVHKFLVFADPDWSRSIVGAVFLLVIAVALFVVKKKALWLYASAEILFALWAAGQTMHDLPNDIDPKGISLAWVKLFGAIYVLIRGFDNWWRTRLKKRIFGNFLEERT